jgi:hypothetical protein
MQCRVDQRRPAERVGAHPGWATDAVSSLESRFIPQGKRLNALGAAFTKHALQEPEQVDLSVRELDAVEQTEPPEEANPASLNDTPVA